MRALASCRAHAVPEEKFLVPQPGSPLRQPQFEEAPSSCLRAGDSRAEKNLLWGLRREIWRTSTSTSAGGEALRARIRSLIKQARVLRGLLSPAALLAFSFLGEALTPSIATGLNG